MKYRKLGSALRLLAALGLGACSSSGGDAGVTGTEEELKGRLAACLDPTMEGGWRNPSDAKRCLDAIPRYPVDPHVIASLCIDGYVDCVSKTGSEELCSPILEACFACADGGDDREDHDDYADDRDDWCEHDDHDDCKDGDRDGRCDDHDDRCDRDDHDDCKDGDRDGRCDEHGDWCDHGGDWDEPTCDDAWLRACVWVREGCEKEANVAIGSWSQPKCNDGYEACVEVLCKISR